MRTYLGIVCLALTSVACVKQGSENEAIVDQTFVHRYGVAVPSDFWSSSGKHGAVVSTMADGVVVTRNYVAGELEGDSTYTYPHSSQIHRKETYLQGNLIKEAELFFDGTQKVETLYDGVSGIKTVSNWYLGGNLKSIEQYCGESLLKADCYNMVGQRDAGVENYEGMFLIRDDYGQLLATDLVQEGKVIMRTTYHPNGSPKEMIPYQNQMVTGVKRTFYPAGEPNTIEQWVAGKQHGMTEMYQHGERFAQIPYENGKRHGVECRFKNGSELVQEISWENDQMHGPSTTYIGGTAKSEWYYQGTPMSKIDYDFMINKPVAR